MIHTAYALEWERNPSTIKPFPQQGMISRQNGIMNYAGEDGGNANPERTFMPTGQGAGVIHEIKPAAEVFADLLRETEETLRAPSRYWRNPPARNIRRRWPRANKRGKRFAH